MKIKEYIFKKAAHKHIPVSGTFELTPRCNLSCEMCYIRMSPEEESAVGVELSTDEWLSLGRQAVDLGMIYLLLTGGEPLLRRDFSEIYTRMAEMGVVISVNTNGTLVNDEIIRCFTEYKPERVNVTLYGASSETYGKVCKHQSGYEAAVRGIEMLHSAEIPVCINTTMTRHNSADIEKMIAYAKSRNIPIRMTSYIFPPIRCTRENETSSFLMPEEYGRLSAFFDSKTLDTEQLNRRRELLKSIESSDNQAVEQTQGRASSCIAGRGAFWITWDGRVLPCGMLPKLGMTLNDYSLSEIWGSFGTVMNDQKLPSGCSQCPRKAICPVCVAVTQSSDKTPDELCRFTESYLKCLR